MKKILAIGIVVALVAAFSMISVFASEPVTMDFVAGAADEDYVAANKEGLNGFFGPYTDGDAADGGSLTMSPTDGAIIDMSVQDAWVTAEISPQEVDMYDYAVVVAKTDDAAAVNGFTIKFGNAGMKWQDWNSVGGKVPMITTDYQTYVFSLRDSFEVKDGGKVLYPGMNKAADASTFDPSSIESIVTYGPEFAVNQGEAKGGKIYIKSVTFTDELPDDYAKPGNSDTPTDPTTPSTPDTPADPTTPSTPDTPDPTTPSTPDTPAPTNPSTPDTPAPTNPSTPNPTNNLPATTAAPAPTNNVQPTTPSVPNPGTGAKGIAGVAVVSAIALAGFAVVSKKSK